MKQGIIIGLDAIPNNTRTSETTLVLVGCDDGITRFIPNLAFDRDNPEDTGILHLLNQSGAGQFSELIGRSIYYRTMDVDDEIIQAFALVEKAL